MQRCPYLHEMKERLLSQPTPTDSLDMERMEGNGGGGGGGGGTPVKQRHDYPVHHANPGVIPEPPEMPPDSLIGTVVKVSPGSVGVVSCDDVLIFSSVSLVIYFRSIAVMCSVDVDIDLDIDLEFLFSIRCSLNMNM